MTGYKKYLTIAGSVGVLLVLLAFRTRPAKALSEQSELCTAGKDLGRFVTAGIYQGPESQQLYLVFESKAGRITIVRGCNGFLYSVTRTEGSSLGVTGYE